MRITATNPAEFGVLISFIGKDMDVAQATAILDAMKEYLSIAEIEGFLHDPTMPPKLMAALHEFNAEMGGLDSY